MDVGRLFQELGVDVKQGKQLNFSELLGIKIYEEQLRKLLEVVESWQVPNNEDELRSLAPKLETLSLILSNSGGINYMDESIGKDSEANFKLMKELNLKIETKYSALLKEITAKIDEFNVDGMPRFLQSMKHFSQYKSHNPLTRKTIVEMEERIEKLAEVYGSIENGVDYGELDGKKLTKFDFVDYMHDKNPELRKKAYRHFKTARATSKESLYFLLQSMAEIKNQMAKLQGFEDAQDSSCKTVLFMDKDVLYGIYDLVKSYMPLMQRLQEVRRKLLKFDKLGAQDLFVNIFEADSFTYKQGMEAIQKYLTAPLTKEYAEYQSMMDNIAASINTTEESVKERRAGAWCHGMQDKESMSAIIFEDKFKGKLLDIRTLAHEMNHGVHALFHMKDLEINNAGTPGYFYEAMAMQAENRMMINWIADAKDKNQKIELLLQKLEDSFSAVFGQTIAHFLELGFYDGRINSYEEFQKEHDRIAKELINPDIDHHEDIEGNLILRVHHFHYTLYCVKYVIAELLAAKLSRMSFDKVAALSEDLIKQISKEDVEACFMNHGINIKGLDWIKEVFAEYEKEIAELEALVVA